MQLKPCKRDSSALTGKEMRAGGRVFADAHPLSSVARKSHPRQAGTAPEERERGGGGGGGSLQTSILSALWPFAFSWEQDRLLLWTLLPWSFSVGNETGRQTRISSSGAPKTFSSYEQRGGNVRC